MAMDQEELKAFVEAVEANTYNAKWILTQYQGRQALMELWCAAKAHAVEMAKPTCEVYHLTTGWAVDPICREHYEGFASKEKAIEWALNEGYRVVPE
jgi:hypothetical protein